MPKHNLYGVKPDMPDAALVKLEEAIEAIKPEAEEMMSYKPIIQTTMNDYGWYMQVLGPIVAEKYRPITLIVWINALIRAGANKAGIADALMVMT